MPSYLDYDWKMRKIESISSTFALDTINVRKTPFLTGGRIDFLAGFNPVMVSKNTYANDGHDWYKIADANGKTAYVSSQVVTIVPEKEAQAERRYIIDLHPDTIIIKESELTIVQEIFSAFCRNLLDRVNNPKPYEMNDQ